MVICINFLDTMSTSNTIVSKCTESVSQFWLQVVSEQNLPPSSDDRLSVSVQNPSPTSGDRL